MTPTPYRGRFAPSPTGPLHFGSLVTALASYLDARANQGHWSVRIEDLDPLRESPSAPEEICESLTAHGLIADEAVSFQSQRHDLYRSAIKTLLNRNRAYFCTCSRKSLAANGGLHPAECRRQQDSPQGVASAVRFALEDETGQWTDLILGPQTQPVVSNRDDPVIERKEGFFAYQLAVVVDDIEQNMSHVIRGSDLLELTTQQHQIYRALGAEPPCFGHIPVVTNSHGQKLSKQNHAPALVNQNALRNLLDALEVLGQTEALHARPKSVSQCLETAIACWDRSRIPGVSASRMIDSDQ